MQSRDIVLLVLLWSMIPIFGLGFAFMLMNVQSVPTWVGSIVLRCWVIMGIAVIVVLLIIIIRSRR